MNSVTRWLYLALIFCGTIWYHGSDAQTSPITIHHQWSQLEFDYATAQDRLNAINSGEFNAGYIAPIDVDLYYPNVWGPRRMFISVPRFQPGVPVTFGTVTNRTYNGNPIIAPYPSWSWHQNPQQCNENHLVSVFRTKIDECGRLWILDTGVLLEEQVCPPQILAFDLETDQLIHRYEIPANQIQSNSLLVTPIVDVLDPPPYGQCNNVFVYAADVQAFALIVHDVNKNTSWKVVDKTMYPYPSYGTHNIAGQQFDLMDGILGMDLWPFVPGQDRVLFFHALSSGTENWVYTSYLRNQSLFENGPSPDPSIFHTYPRTRHTQAAAQAIDRDGIAYFGLASDLTINCWNTATSYGDQNIGIIDWNPTTLQFASGVKVIINTLLGGQELWFITMRFQKVATGTLNPNEINFRIQAANIKDLTAFDKCLPLLKRGGSSAKKVP